MDYLTVILTPTLGQSLALTFLLLSKPSGATKPKQLW